MKVVIMGCGRVGAQLATMLDQEGHSVTALDLDAYSFRRLPPDFKGNAILGNGLDEEVLRRAGIEEADAFVAVTQGDNRNVMAAQMAQKIFNVKKVVCRIYDPLRRDLYTILGLEAISPTTVFAEMLKEKLES
ncbi:potassium channel family protein [Dehalogenimonas alkenigignens]|jgi:trk system potassium uptake protein|uniref:TrkA-N domain n=1 Tax=Dehalogenimonas alkenigignens TaxID=1217799 RepID=A0A0W0GGT2_9CHLR|nr:TrkA family potassium uptake protein [Dehalogenimonas alkenigignens]KTB47741.1 TrkA-N domain [Dehalogenimonas alkenigignens]PVV83996.1 TrkA family potassium uptake protein [Dehalogenimonas alkenigignens]